MNPITRRDLSEYAGDIATLGQAMAAMLRHLAGMTTDTHHHAALITLAAGAELTSDKATLMQEIAR